MEASALTPSPVGAPARRLARRVHCCACAPTTSSWRSSAPATTRRSGSSTTATASGCSPTRARCSAARAPTPRTCCRTSSCAPTTRCAPTTAESAAGVALPRRAQPLHRPAAPPGAAPPEDVYELAAASGVRPAGRGRAPRGLRRLIADVARLPEQQRSALLMREMEGLSYNDLAEALDVTVPAIKSLLVRARVGLVGGHRGARHRVRRDPDRPRRRLRSRRARQRPRRASTCASAPAAATTAPRCAGSRSSSTAWHRPRAR